MGLSDPPRKFRCSRGHQWEESVGSIMNPPRSISFFGGPSLCIQCFKEFWQDKLGAVEEIKNIEKEGEPA